MQKWHALGCWHVLNIFISRINKCGSQFKLFWGLSPTKSNSMPFIDFTPVDTLKPLFFALSALPQFVTDLCALALEFNGFDPYYLY
jgi:hypothetical protein